MTDAQFTALMTAVVAGFGSLCAVVGSWLKGRAAARKEQTRATLYEADSKIELATALAAQRSVLEGITRWIQIHTPGAEPLEIERERTPVRSMLPPLTPTQMRAFGHQDDDPETPPERPLARRRSEVGPPRRTPARGIQLSHRRPDSQHDEE